LEAWRAAFDKPLGAQSPIVEVLNAMSNDLDTPAALKAVDDWARETISGAEVESTGEVAKVVDAILGII
jgi:L-cysteine:1D-myo-inositol 2-amino-2-deoxy-alpha-D-glucopyranoside ligase